MSQEERRSGSGLGGRLDGPGGTPGLRAEVGGWGTADRRPPVPG